jgi:hypothetical protein
MDHVSFGARRHGEAQHTKCFKHAQVCRVSALNLAEIQGLLHFLAGQTTIKAARSGLAHVAVGKGTTFTCRTCASLPASHSI